MRQLLLDKRNIVVKSVAQPLLDEHSILVAVHYAYISDSTVIANVNTQEHFLSNVPQKVKRVLQAVSSHAQSTQKTFTGLGYPCAGHVVAVGKKVHKFAPGDLVACADPGYTTHADLICIPSRHAVKINDRAFTKSASLTTFAAVALHGFKQAHVGLGQRVAVFGLDLLGQFTVQFAKLSGCEVIAFDTIASRLELAKSYGADRVFSLDVDVAKEIDLLTERHGLDAAIMTQPYDLTQVLSVVKCKGRAVLVGTSDVHIPPDSVNKREQEIVLIPASGHDQIPHSYLKTSLAFIESGKLKVDSFIREQVEIHELRKAYKRVANKATLGLVLAYDRNAQQTAPVVPLVERPLQPEGARFIPAVSDVVRVGIIGAGGFAQNTLLPILSGMRNIQLSAIVDTNKRSSLNVSQEFNVARICNQEQEMFENDLVDIVVIASEHSSHGEQAINALKHGKGVFLEKPMVTDFAQLQQLYALLKKHPGIPFCVDYSKSYSPFIQKIKSVVEKRNTPLMMQYRMNTDTKQAHDWMFAHSGSGRILDEACQIVHLFCYLTGAHPIAVSVEAMHAARDDIFPTDNFTAHISFSDGSVGSLLCTSLGHPEMGVERFELFFDEKAILMEEYMELYGFGLPSWFNETVTNPDLGHEALFTKFFGAFKQEPFKPPFSLERLHSVAHITLLIDQLACEGGGSREL